MMRVSAWRFLVDKAGDGTSASAAAANFLSN